MDKYATMNKLCEQIPDTYKRKNTAYNDAFGKTVQKYGPISALTRMSDKWFRIEALMMGIENNVQDESLEDTLIDMATYSLMTLIELRIKNDVS